MELFVAKLIVLTGMFVVTLTFSMLPLKLVSVAKRTLDPQRRYQYKRAIGLLNCFGGGVFLGACLLDLFPEVRDELNEAFDRLDITSSYPVAEFVMVFGFFLAFIVEQIMLAFREQRMSFADDERSPLIGHDATSQRQLSKSYRTEVESNHGTADDGIVAVPYSPSANGDPRDFYSDVESHSTLRCIALLLALSLHSVFEGFAIGLQDNMMSLAQILAAVAIHKSVIAFSLGLNLVQSNLRLKTLLLMNLLFSVTTPVGIATGIGILHLSHSVSLLSGVLQGIACGTFLFVTFFEVLPHEMNGKHDRLPKVLATIVGFAAVCGALFLESSDQRPSCFRGARKP